jgi:hypothetical protein
MSSVIAIPTIPGREESLNQCLNSILQDKSYQGQPIIVYNPQQRLQERIEIPTMYYTTRKDLDPIIEHLSNKLKIEPYIINTFFEPSDGGSRNALTLLSLILLQGVDVKIIGTDDDVTVEDGFIGAHEEYLGKPLKRKGIVKIVVGPCEHHDAYVGVETLIKLLKGKIPQDRVEEACNAITYVDFTPYNSIKTHPPYFIGSNMSRCGEALLVPFIAFSVRTQIDNKKASIVMRGSDQMYGKMCEITYSVVSIYTPKARVHHQRSKDDIIKYILGELLGYVVSGTIIKISPEKVFNGMEIDDKKLEEIWGSITTTYLFRFREMLESSWRQREKRRRYKPIYTKELDKEIDGLYYRTMRALNSFEQDLLHACRDFGRTLQSLPCWSKIIDVLSEDARKLYVSIFGRRRY